VPRFRRVREDVGRCGAGQRRSVTSTSRQYEMNSLWEDGERTAAEKYLLANAACAMTRSTKQIKRFFPMPIRKHLTDKAAFGPVAIEAMSKAFEETCIALRVHADDEKGREIIATRINRSGARRPD
jgi:hypothetical protein